MSLYYLIVWNQVDILFKNFKKDHVHMHLWMRFYGMTLAFTSCQTLYYSTHDHSLFVYYYFNLETHLVDSSEKNVGILGAGDDTGLEPFMMGFSGTVGVVAGEGAFLISALILGVDTLPWMPILDCWRSACDSTSVECGVRAARSSRLR